MITDEGDEEEGGSGGPVGKKMKGGIGTLQMLMRSTSQGGGGGGFSFKVPGMVGSKDKAKGKAKEGGDDEDVFRVSGPSQSQSASQSQSNREPANEMETANKTVCLSASRHPNPV